MRCLVVEDDPDIQTDLARALEAAGFTVDYAGDGQSAWYRGDVEDYDAAVLDLGLPRLDGADACTAASRLTEHWRRERERAHRWTIALAQAPRGAIGCGTPGDRDG